MTRQPKTRGRLLPAVLVLVVGALAAGTVTWLVSSGDRCSSAPPAAITATSTPTATAAAKTGGPIPKPLAVDPQAGCSGLAPAGVSAGGVLLVGFVAVMLAVMKPSFPVPAGAPQPISAPPPAAPAVSDAVVDERRTLVDALIYALDRLEGTAVEARLRETLAKVGVRAVGVEGERFDPARHEAVATLAATSEQQAGLVGDVDAVGYLDGDVLIRPAQVSVYQSGR